MFALLDKMFIFVRNIKHYEESVASITEKAFADFGRTNQTGQIKERLDHGSNS